MKSVQKQQNKFLKNVGFFFRCLKKNTHIDLYAYTIYLMRRFVSVVSLYMFTSCAVFWRARRANQNTNNE